MNGVIIPIVKSIGYPNITSKVVEENSRALGAMELIVKNTKSDVGHSKRDGVHTNKHTVLISMTRYSRRCMRLLGVCNIVLDVGSRVTGE